ncbi:MAG: hypothetical protein Athens071416_22 [Parcubacteria group bacterium Athens0714_16]|nr:MAG: hypothetical protein Athens071416_22 [Parcubacteria group bacterium Athens0714_16]
MRKIVLFLFQFVGSTGTRFSNLLKFLTPEKEMREKINLFNKD